MEKELFDQIAKLIQSDNSPVGIDAKKTHVLILGKLEELQKELSEIKSMLRKNADE